MPILSGFVADLEPNTIQTLRTADNAYVKAPSSPNDTSRDEMWASMNLDRIVVALDHEEARHLGLPKSTNFIWDDTKEYFGINAYHQLHCLVCELPLPLPEFLAYTLGTAKSLHDSTGRPQRYTA